MTINLNQLNILKLPVIEAIWKHIFIWGIGTIFNTILINQLSFRYSQYSPWILSGVSLEIKPGEFVAIVGASGSGKSTLVRLLLNFEQPLGGSIYIDKQALSTLNMLETRRHMGVVMQQGALLAGSIFENVALPLTITGFRYSEMKRRVSAALDKVGLLNKEKALPVELSTGEQQRVGIARAIVNKPRLVLADEPTGNLDPELSLEIIRLFEAFSEVGVTVLVATHDLALIAPLNHRIFTLKEGRLIGGVNDAG